MPLTALTCAVFYKQADYDGMNWPLIIFLVVQLNHSNISSFSFLAAFIKGLIMISLMAVAQEEVLSWFSACW